MPLRAKTWGNNLLELVVHKPAQAMHQVPEGLGAFAGVLLQSPAIASEKRTGKPLVPPKNFKAAPDAGGGKVFVIENLHLPGPIL